MKTPAALQPQDRVTPVVEHFVRGLAWTVQACAAAAYLYVAAQPIAWRRMFPTDPASAIFLPLIALTMTFLWAASLREETKRFYDRRHQQLLRKAGLIGHLSLLLVAVAAASEQAHRIGLWIILGMTAFAALTTWTVCMQTRFLPDDDQAVVDVILSREAEQRAAAHDASERQKRRVRLTAIVESLGYTLIDAPAQAGNATETPAVKWTIPAGKHAPLVYFIRNGNRMKIGTTVELKRRIRTLALRAENVALLVDGGQRREREYHKQFAEHRIGNTEWFAYEGTLADYVHAEISRAAQKEKGQ